MKQMINKGLVWLLCLSMLAVTLVGCLFEKDDDVTEENTTETTPADTVAEQEPKLSSLKINGTNISEYRIVYPVSFTREQCFEDMSVAAEKLLAELEALLGVRLSAVPDTEDEAEKEILLGASARAECIRYYNEATKLKTDEYCVMYSNGKLLLGADCLAGVVDACDVFVKHLKDEATKGNTDVNIAEGFDLSGEKHITRVVCVGDSITQGVGAKDEISQSYPSQLQQNLGYEYDVINYGKGGATMCAYANTLYETRAYIEKSGYYDDLLAIAPYTDVVVIMLGSNDASGDPTVTALLQNDFNSFKTDYSIHLSQMVSDLREINKNIEIMLFSTTRVYPDGPRQKNITTYLRPFQTELAHSQKLGFYDMYEFSATKMTAADFDDGLHPTSAGYQKMAEAAADALKQQYGFN